MNGEFRGRPHLLDVGGLVGLVIGRIGVLVARLVLVRVRGHEALDGDEDRLESLCRGPLLAALASPCSDDLSIRSSPVDEDLP